LIEKYQLIIHRKRRRNVAGTIDDIPTQGSHLHLPEWLAHYDVTDMIVNRIQWMMSHPGEAEVNTAMSSLNQQFGALGGLVEDGQKHFAITFLGGSAIMARYDAIHNVGQGQFYWTRARLEKLQNKFASGATPAEVAASFGIHGDEIKRGVKKLLKMNRTI
jgi:hypothetical protein